MVPEVIYIDAGAFVARYRRNDEWHKDAVRGWAELERSGSLLLTSSLVIVEAARYLLSTTGAVRTAERARLWLDSERLTILRPTLEDELQAVDLMVRYADQAIGMIDCISFVLMRQRGLKTVFGFDRHFTVAGLQLWPGAGKWRK